MSDGAAVRDSGEPRAARHVVDRTAAGDRRPQRAGARETLVMVPGLDGTALLFHRQIPRLARRFDVITFPLPDSREPDMADLVEALRERAQDANPGGVIVCGESFGGALALSFALAHPEQVRGLVIVNSFARVPQRVQLALAPWLLRAVPWAAMPAVRRFTVHRLRSPHAQAEDLHEFHERSKAIGRTGYIRRLEILRHYDVRDRLHEITAPTLLLAGDRDQLLPSVAQARFMAERIPRATLHVLRGYGHLCLIDRDLDLLACIAPWWEREAARSYRA